MRGVIPTTNVFALQGHAVREFCHAPLVAKAHVSSGRLASMENASIWLAIGLRFLKRG